MNATSDRVRVLAEDRWLFNQLEKRHPGKGITPTPATIELFDERFKADHEQISTDWFGGKEPLFAANWAAPEPIDEVEEAAVAKDIEELIAAAMRKHRLSGLLRLPRRLARRLLGR